MIMDGELLRGSDSAEGDIGHAKILGVEETCSSCGEPGCLAAIASGRAMVRDLRRLGHSPVTTRDVVDLVRKGDPDAVRIVTAAGRALGDVLSTAVSLLNPDVLVIGGDIAHAHERFVRGVRDTLPRRHLGEGSEWAHEKGSLSYHRVARHLCRTGSGRRSARESEADGTGGHGL